MKLVLTSLLLIAAVCLAQGPKKFSRTQNNAKSPAKETSVTIAGKTINISYSAPSVRGRTIFGDSGILKSDGTYPVWRAGADEATQLHTDADLTINGLAVPKGDYTLWVDLDAGKWQLIVNKKQSWGTDYDKSQDVGRTAMTMSKPSAPVEQYRMTLTSAGGNRGKLELAWENMAASVNFTVK
ncbi:MAG TPA: DUF2911 domain-containing protein [Bryobacteraceae bacterium]|jgi:hypothetical protein